MLPWARLEKDAGTTCVASGLSTYLANKKELEENRAGRINGERRSRRSQFVDHDDRKNSKKLSDRQPPPPHGSLMPRMSVFYKPAALHGTGKCTNSKITLSFLHARWYVEKHTTLPDMRMLAGGGENTLLCPQDPCPTFTHPQGDVGVVLVESLVPDDAEIVRLKKLTAQLRASYNKEAEATVKRLEGDTSGCLYWKPSCSNGL